MITKEKMNEFYKYEHLNLSSFEWWAIVIGIILILIGREIKDKQKGLSKALYIVGIMAGWPLVMVIFALISKAVAIAIILSLIVGALYLLFGKN